MMLIIMLTMLVIILSDNHIKSKICNKEIEKIGLTPSVLLACDVNEEILEEISKNQEQIETEISSVEIVEVAEPATVFRINISEEEIQLMYRVVMSEAGGQEYAGKVAVAETIINRVLMDVFPDNVTDVVYSNNQYSTGYNGDPNEECIQAVQQALQYPTFDCRMVYFRSGYFHEWAEDYIQIDKHYFSLR